MEQTKALRASRPAGGSSAAGVPPNKTSTIYTKIYTWNLKLYGTSSEYCLDSFHIRLHWIVMYTWSQGRSIKAKSVDRALSCILGVSKRDIFWVLPNMYPESYDCGLPGHLAVIRAAMMDPGVHSMSDELILQISCNIFLAEAKIYHIIRQLSYRFMCEIMTWSDDKTKLIHKNISTRLRLRALEP